MSVYPGTYVGFAQEVGRRFVGPQGNPPPKPKPLLIWATIFRRDSILRKRKTCDFTVNAGWMLVIERDAEGERRLHGDSLGSRIAVLDRNHVVTVKGISANWETLNRGNVGKINALCY